MLRTALILLTTTALAVSVGCGQTGAPETNEDTSPTPEQTSTPQPTPDPGQTVDLSGVWAAQFITSQTFTTDVADPASTTLTTLARLDITQSEGGAMTTALEICNLDLAPLGDTPTIITWPEATVQTVQVMGASATVDTEYEGASFNGNVVVLVAWNPDADAATEAIPVDANDPRVFDADGDGEVGSTLLVDSTIDGEVYGVARTVVDLTGKVQNQDFVGGSSSTVLELNILDASSGFLEIDISAVQDSEVPSDFALVRMDGNPTCSDIVAGAGTIF